MKITFVLPCYKKDAPGGFKVMYDYANRLAKLGNDVTVMVPHKPNFHHPSLSDIFKSGLLIYKIKICIKEIYHSFMALIRGKSVLRSSIEEWLNNDVKISTPFSLKSKSFSSDQTYVVSWWENALLFSQNETLKTVYLCQHYEDWGGESSLVSKSYELSNVKYVSISSWVSNQLKNKHSRESVQLLNSLSNSEFHSITPIIEREYDVGLILRFDEEWKGSDIALEFINSLSTSTKILIASYDELPSQYSDLNVTVKKCRSNKDMNEFYNSIKTFVFTSHFEGFGLPILESMLCGNLLISTPVGCAEDLIKHEDNAMLASEVSSQSLLDCYYKSSEYTDEKLQTLSLKAIESGELLNPEKQTKVFESILSQC